jgi:hypothetical protein
MIAVVGTMTALTRGIHEMPVVPSEVVARGSTRDLCEQFVLSESLDTPDGFESESLGTWRLAHHPTLPVIHIEDQSGARLGWLLGYPITAQPELLRSGSTVTVDASVDPLAFVDDLGGRFLAVFVSGPSPAIYPDAAASYASVFCPSMRLVASTASLIPYDLGTTDRLDVLRELDIPFSTNYFPFGLTHRHGVEQLQPNHHLDLERWEAVRHGPRPPARGSWSVEESAARVAAIIQRHFAAVLEQYAGYLPITSGHDSRMLLACAREHRDELALYTLRIPDLNGARDAYVASHIAQRLGLEHQRVSMIAPSPRDLELWSYRSGCVVGEPRGRHAATTYRSLDRSRVRFNGQIGDLLRTPCRTPDDSEDSVISVERVAMQAINEADGAEYRSKLSPGQLRVALSPLVLERAERWLAGLSGFDGLTVIDLNYLESSVAPWAGPWAYAEFFDPGFTLFPMCHREIVDIFLALPERERRDNSLQRAIIRAHWPELLEWPFNVTPWQVTARQFPRRAARRAGRCASTAKSRIVDGTSG